MPASAAYRPLLAYVHDTGFGDLGRDAARALLAELRPLRPGLGTVVELGCGSGILSQPMAAAGYDVCGFDVSAAMVELARKRVPSGVFHRQAVLDVRLPKCVAVAAVGEVFNYRFDDRNTLRRLRQLFVRVFDSLVPGGVFLFDVATPGRGGPAGQQRSHTEGRDWACLVAVAENARSRTLSRAITTFRRQGDKYRRDYELHRLRLYTAQEVASGLRAAGFRVRARSAYDKLPLPHGLRAFFARKPS